MPNNSTRRAVASSGTAKSARSHKKQPRNRHHFSFPRGPVTLCISSVLLISIMAIFYLSQAEYAFTANHQLQDIHNQSAILTREDQDLAGTVATEQSPAYIVAQAQKMGLGPVDPTKLWIMQVSLRTR